MLRCSQLQTTTGSSPQQNVLLLFMQSSCHPEGKGGLGFLTQ